VNLWVHQACAVLNVVHDGGREGVEVSNSQKFSAGILIISKQRQRQQQQQQTCLGKAQEKDTAKELISRYID